MYAYALLLDCFVVNWLTILVVVVVEWFQINRRMALIS